MNLRTISAAGAQPRGISLANSTLYGHAVQVIGGSVDLSNTTIEAPKGLIRLQSLAPQGTIQLDNSRLDVEAHSLSDVSAPAYRTVGAATYAITPLIHLQASGDLEIRHGSQLNASQDLNTLRRALARADDPPLDPAAISLVSTSGNVVLESDRAVRIDHSQLRVDASDNLAGTIGIVARGSDEGLRIDSSTLSARGGAGSGDIRLSSSGGIGIRASQLLTESGRAPTSDGISADWENFSPYSGGEITLLNTSTTRPISVEGSRLEALTHTQEGVLQPYLYEASLGTEIPFTDVHDGGDSLSLTIDNLDPKKPIGMFPQGRILLVSDAGIGIGNNSVVDAGSHPHADPGRLEAFGGRITLLNRSSGASLEVQDSSLLNRSDPAAAYSFSNPYDASQPLLVGRPGQLELWSAGGLTIQGSQVDGGQAGGVSLASLTPAELQEIGRAHV